MHFTNQDFCVSVQSNQNDFKALKPLKPNFKLSIANIDHIDLICCVTEEEGTGDMLLDC